jgi:hypothetical protein
VALLIAVHADSSVVRPKVSKFEPSVTLPTDRINSTAVDPVLYEWDQMEIGIQSWLNRTVRNGLEIELKQLLESASRTNQPISASCSQSLIDWFDALSRIELWAFQSKFIFVLILILFCNFTFFLRLNVV